MVSYTTMINISLGTLTFGIILRNVYVCVYLKIEFSLATDPGIVLQYNLPIGLYILICSDTEMLYILELLAFAN